MRVMLPTPDSRANEVLGFWNSGISNLMKNITASVAGSSYSVGCGRLSGGSVEVSGSSFQVSSGKFLLGSEVISTDGESVPISQTSGLWALVLEGYWKDAEGDSENFVAADGTEIPIPSVNREYTSLFRAVQVSGVSSVTPSYPGGSFVVETTATGTVWVSSDETDYQGMAVVVAMYDFSKPGFVDRKSGISISRVNPLRVVLRKFSLQSSVWTSDSSGGEYAYKALISDSEVTSKSFAVLGLDSGSMSVAQGAVLSPVVVVSDGSIQINAKVKPTTTLNGFFYLVESGDEFGRGVFIVPADVDTASRKALWYGTCSTAGATTSKVVNIDKFVLETGSKIVVKVTTENTAASITLNVSGTGEKTVVDLNNQPISAVSATLFSGMVFLMYDGTNWVILRKVASSTSVGEVKLSDVINANGASTGQAATPLAVYNAIKDMKPPVWGTCSTAASTAAKTVSVTGITSLVAGQSFMVYVTNKSTVVPTLNVNSLGAKTVADKNGVTLTTTNCDLFDGLVFLVYDGSKFILLDAMGTSSERGGVKLSDSTGSSSGVSSGVAATPAAVKSVADTAAARATKVLYTATLNTTWTTNSSGGYYKTVTVSGILASDNPIVGLVQTSTVTTNQTLLEGWSLVSRITTSANSITVYCYDDKPTVSLPIQILCVR